MDTNKIMKRLMTVTMSLMILLYCLTPCLPITEFNTVAANIQEVAVDDKVKQVALGSHHSACITEDGTLYTWGSNEYGQLGDGTLEDRSYPLKIMENVKQVSLGTNHSACITEDGSLYLWGNNYYGQIGNGKSSSNYKDGYAYVAEPIKIMNDVKQIELGENYSACITEDDSLYTWGWNEFGNLGNGEYGSDKYVTSPDKIMNNVKQVSICYEHSAAITKNGRLYMWGHNLYSFGDGGREDSYLPVRVMDDIDQIEVGYHFSTCIADNGTLYTWGRNDFGQLGNGRRGQNEIENYPLEIMKGVSQLETGFYNAACITSDGDMYTWGDYNTTPDKKIGNVKQASVSQSNYACVTNDGELYVWGDNE